MFCIWQNLCCSVVMGIYATCCSVFLGNISNPSLVIHGISIIGLLYPEIIQLHTNKNSVGVHIHSEPIYQDTKVFLFCGVVINFKNNMTTIVAVS